MHTELNMWICAFPNTDLDMCDIEICDLGMKIDIQSTDKNKENGGFILLFLIKYNYIDLLVSIIVLPLYTLIVILI